MTCCRALILDCAASKAISKSDIDGSCCRALILDCAASKAISKSDIDGSCCRALILDCAASRAMSKVDIGGSLVEQEGRPRIEDDDSSSSSTGMRVKLHQVSLLSETCVGWARELL